MAPYLSLSDQRRLQVTLPEIRTQNAVAEVMSALDDKIAVNDRIADVGRQLAQAEFQAAVQTKDSVECGLAFVSEFLSRGVTPRYSEDAGQLIVLNQKCIRDGRVSLAPSRWTEKDAVPITKLLRTNDVLVNSTGVGTLGRVARWVYEQPCTVDSHVTIVRFDAAKADPVCAGFAMLAAQPDIEAMGEGSTGQTELGRTRLGEVRLTMPGKTHTERLRPILDALEGRGNAALAESAALADLRDTLLARLMSGEIRVRDAEKIVGDAT
jgi:type I restriction enzyme S subunit